MQKMNMKMTLSLILVVLSTVLIVLSASVTLAKYARVDKDDDPVTPKSFYFESDILGDTNNVPAYYLGVNEIRISLMNFADSLRYSEVDITYDLTISEGGAVIEEKSLRNQTLTAVNNGPADAVTHIISGLAFGKTYTVTATATAPYAKTLTATFTVYDERNSVSYSVYPSTAEAQTATYGDKVVYLEIKTNEVGKKVAVYWQNGYVPDNAYGIQGDSQGTVDLNVELEPYSTYVLKFYKSNSATTYDSTRFFVEMVIDGIEDNPMSPDIGDTEGDITDIEGEWG